MSIKTRGFLALAIGTILGFSMSLAHTVLAERQPPEGLPHQYAALLAEVMERVREDYVDEVDYDTLIEGAIRGMVGGLDDHSSFLDTEQYEDVRIATSGNYSGVGLEVSVENDQIVVVSPIDDTPAERAGILPGDVILGIDDATVSPERLEETIGMMRGEPGTTVRLKISRDANAEPLDFSLTRARIHVASVKGRLLDEDLGYLRITQFSETTGRDLRRAVRKLKRENGQALAGLVLDLRNNPGGVLDAAVDVSDAFLDEGLIVSADGRLNEARFELYAHEGDLIDGARLVVLVNKGSASASEIVAGALQDHQRGVIMGSTTFGKGTVQTVTPLINGRALKLTTARYFTPSGDSIHERGIEPDIALDPGQESVTGEYGVAEALRYLKEPKAVILQSKSD